MFRDFYEKGARTARVKTALRLEFDSPEQYQQHVHNRELAGSAGKVLGAAGLGALGGRRWGVPGLAAGAVAGGLLGDAPGKFVADVAHDYRQRAAIGPTTHALDAAAGFSSPKIAAAEPTATDFAEFAQSYEASPTDPRLTGFEADLEKRERPVGLGHSSSLEGGDDATRNEVVGIGKYDGV